MRDEQRPLSNRHSLARPVCVAGALTLAFPLGAGVWPMQKGQLDAEAKT